MERVILIGAFQGAPATVTIDGNLYATAIMDSNGALRVVPGVPPGSSGSVAGSVTAPGAGAVIATTIALTGGTYDVQVMTDYGGTPAAAETFNNMQLRVGATVIGPVFTSPGTLAVPVNQRFILIVPGATAITVNAVNAGGAAAVYQALIIWTPVG